MSRWSGVIAYHEVTQQAPGIWSDQGQIVEKPYKGDLIRKSYRLENGSDINDGVRLNNEIKVLGDQYAFDNIENMVYITCKGSKWEISSVDATRRPRLTITLGGIYK